MKLKTFTISVLTLLLAAGSVSAQRSFLSNYGLSVNAGTTGIGATASVSLLRNFNLRAGFGIMPFHYNYTMDDLGSVEVEGYEVRVPSLPLKAKLRVPAAHVLVDYTPFKKGMSAFHITAGLYAGEGKMALVSGRFDMTELHRLGISAGDIPPIEIGDARIRVADDGKVEAYAKVNAVRPYFGVGWGNAIPRGRVGFRFDIGAMYQGKPEIMSPNLEGEVYGDDSDDLNKVLSKLRFYPQLSFQLTFRLLKD